MLIVSALTTAYISAVTEVSLIHEAPVIRPVGEERLITIAIKPERPLEPRFESDEAGGRGLTLMVGHAVQVVVGPRRHKDEDTVRR